MTFGLSQESFRTFCRLLLVGLGLLAIGTVPLLLDRARPVQGVGALLMRIGLVGFFVFSTVAWTMPAIGAIRGLRQDPRPPGARSILLFTSGLAIASATMAMFGFLLPSSSTPGPTVPPILFVPLVFGAVLFLIGAFFPDGTR